MSALASLPAMITGGSPAPVMASAATLPIVFVDGIPHTALTVEQIDMRGPDDRRSALISVDPTAVAADGELPNRLLEVEASLMMPARLMDQQMRRPVMVRGKLVAAERQLQADADRHRLTLIDQWNQTLDQSIATAWWQTDDGLLFNQDIGAVMGIGDEANRSLLRWNLANPSVYVLQHNGLAWTVQTALETLSALGNLELSLRLLPCDILQSPLVQPIDLAQPIGRGLTSILDSYGLIVQRDIAFEGSGIMERRALRPAEQGRRVTVTWSRDNQPAGQVLQIDSDRPAARARLWIAQTNGYLVESTFTLAAGWDPAFEGQSDATYSRSSSADFAKYANVYRLWVLNEDGFFTAQPYNQGPPFDLTSFFGQDAIAPRPLRFLSGLTLDDAGRRQSPFVEMSTDNGQTWSAYPTITSITTKRAAVYLDDTTLPSAFFSAAKAGNARIRVTGGLQSPQPVRVVRWQGNPFSGSDHPRIVQLDDTFQFARVDSGSIHFSDVQNGNAIAQESDDLLAMGRWLVQRMRRRDAVMDKPMGKATLTLAGNLAMLRIGDYMIDAGGRGSDIANRAQAVARRGAYVQAIRYRWRTAADPTTVAKLVF